MRHATAKKYNRILSSQRRTRADPDGRPATGKTHLVAVSQTGHEHVLGQVGWLRLKLWVRSACLALHSGHSRGQPRHHEIAVKPQHLTRVGKRVENHTRNHGTNGVYTVGYRGNHTKVAASPLQGPKQVGMLARTCADQLTTGDHHIVGQRVVADQPAPAHQPSYAAAKSQSGDTRG